MSFELANSGYSNVASIRHGYESISQPLQLPSQMWGNISLNISSVNQLEMPAPGAKAQDAACAEHLESSDGAGAEGAAVGGVEGTGVDGAEGLRVGSGVDGSTGGGVGSGPELPEH